MSIWILKKTQDFSTSAIAKGNLIVLNFLFVKLKRKIRHIIFN